MFDKITTSLMGILLFFSVNGNALTVIPTISNSHSEEEIPTSSCPLVVDYVINSIDQCLVPNTIGPSFDNIEGPNSNGEMTVDLNTVLPSPNTPLSATGADSSFGMGIALGDDIFYLKINVTVQKKNKVHFTIEDTQDTWTISRGICDEWIIKNSYNNQTAAIISPSPGTTWNLVNFMVNLYSASSCFLYHYPMEYTMVACNSQLQGSNPSNQVENRAASLKQSNTNVSNLWTVSNPVSDQLHVQFAEELNDHAALTLYTMQGQLVFETTIPSNSSQSNISVQNLSAGAYVCLITTSQARHASIIVKQ